MACIHHSDSTDKHGYGRRDGHLSHRLAYVAHHGLPIEAIKGQHVLHLCDNPRCINPAHLSLGTHQDNMDDRNAKGRQAKGETHGAAVLTAEQVATIRSRYKRYCRINGGPALARECGVCAMTITNVVRNLNWN